VSGKSLTVGLTLSACDDDMCDMVAQLRMVRTKMAKRKRSGARCVLVLAFLVALPILKHVKRLALTHSKSTDLKLELLDDVGCTVLLNVYERRELAAALALHYASIPFVRAVLITWSGDAACSESIMRYLSNWHQRAKIKFVHIRDDLNERFSAVSHTNTDCNIVADDDIFVEEDHIRTVYEAWTRQPTRLVGIFPRDVSTMDGVLQYRSKPIGRYSIILTKFMLVNRMYLLAYTRMLPEGARDYVTSKKNCEDIALNFLVSYLTGLQPLHVSIPKHDYGGLKGIYTRPGHFSTRHTCVSAFSEIFNHTSLSISRLTISPAHVDPQPFVEDSFTSSQAELEAISRILRHRTGSRDPLSRLMHLRELLRS